MNGMEPIYLILLTLLAGCTVNEPPQADPALVVKLATVNAVQGDSVRAQQMADACASVMAEIVARQSVPIESLIPLLRRRIDAAPLHAAERELLQELVSSRGTDTTTSDTRVRLYWLFKEAHNAAASHTLSVSQMRNG
jgi:hypothetical protein